MPTVPMKVFALSDLHADYPQNLRWAQTLVEQEFQNDILILAGDVSEDLLLLGQVLEIFKTAFSQVLFVPGNHELWVRSGPFNCSLEKFRAVQRLCDELEVLTGAYHHGGLSILPLLSWYDFSFGAPDRYLRLAWRDFRACRWPAHLSDESAITDYFLALNEPLLSVRNDTVISFSHFLPDISVMPESIPASRRRVYPVLGSHRLGEQLQRLRPHIHVYGHSHVNQSRRLRGIEFINNAFAYPDETRIARKALHLLWDSEAVNARSFG